LNRSKTRILDKRVVIITKKNDETVDLPYPVFETSNDYSDRLRSDKLFLKDTGRFESLLEAASIPWLSYTHFYWCDPEDLQYITEQELGFSDGFFFLSNGFSNQGFGNITEEALTKLCGVPKMVYECKDTFMGGNRYLIKCLEPIYNQIKQQYPNLTHKAWYTIMRYRYNYVVDAKHSPEGVKSYFKHLEERETF